RHNRHLIFRLPMKSIRETVAAAAVLLATPLPLMSEGIAEPPLPSVAAVLERVARQTEKESDNERAFNQHYGYTRTKVTEYVIAKAEVYLTEAVNVVGGLVGAVWKFNYSFDPERTSEGLWFTRAVDWHLEGREVILHRAIDYHEGKTGVRKLW